MGSFGNYVGATMGTSTNEEGQSGAVYDNSWVTNSNYSKRAALVGPDGKTFVHVDDFKAPDTDGVYKPNSNLLGDVPGLLSDQTTNQEVVKQLTGPKALNWEAKTFTELKNENAALNPTQIDAQATAWTSHGNDLKTESEDFKKKVRTAITGKWSGDSADAAEAATQHVTETSIYDFNPTSTALASRLNMLRDAFKIIKQKFPEGNDLIDSGNFNKDGLDKKIHDFNSRYHLDGSGHLRNNSDGYVTAADALRELDQIKRSITDYQQAVQLFRDTYNPTVQAVTENFPTLPPPPNMKFGQPGTGPGSGPGSGPGGGPGIGPGASKFDPANTKTPAISTPDLGKDLNTKLPDTKLPDSKLPDTNTTDPTKSTGQNGLSGLTGPLSSAMDAAKDAIGQAADAAKGAGQGLQDPNAAGAQGPPEGVLGIGPQGLGGGGVGSGAGGVAGGASASRGLAIGKTMDAPAAAVAKAPAAAAGAGLGSGAGSPGAGAPAAGQRGDQNGKGHQVNKALRRKKNGKNVIGDVEAAVAVVGAAENQDQQPDSHVDLSDRTEQSDAATPNAAPPTRRIPRVGKPMQVPGQ